MRSWLMLVMRCKPSSAIASHWDYSCSVMRDCGTFAVTWVVPFLLNNANAKSAYTGTHLMSADQAP
ncbi:MAG: hypothetical protein ACYDBB_10215 [Armatimonadota bacterium]